MTQSKRTKNSTLEVKLSTYVLPHFREKKVNSQDWIDFGANNLFPLYLVDLYNESAVHNAIITGKVNYIVGRGLTIKTERGVEKVRKYAKDNDLHELYKRIVCEIGRAHV